MDENISHSVRDNSKLGRLAYIILLVVTFLVPIFFVPVSFISPQFGTSLLFAFSVILCILLYIVSSLTSGAMDLPKPGKYMLGFLAIVPIMYTLAAIANGFSRMSFFGYTFDIATAGFIILGFAYLFLVSFLFRQKNHIFFAYFAFLVSALLLSIFLLVRIIFGATTLSFGTFTTLTSTVLGNWNNVGIFFGIGAILSLLTYEMVHISKFMKVLLSVALLLSLFFLALVNFSAIWMIVGFCAFLFILYSMFSGRSNPFAQISFRKRLSHIPLYPAIVLIVSVVFVIWGSTLGSFLATSLNVTNVEVRPTLAVTLDIARNTLQQRPLFGSGPNNFVTEWLTWKPDAIVNTVFWNTDFANGIGLIPTFVVTTGLLGLLSWLLFLGFFVYLGIKAIFLKIEDVFMKYLLVSSFFVSLYLWIMAFVYVPSAPIFILTFFFTGLFFSSVYLSGLVSVHTKVFSSTPRLGFLASLVMIAFFVGAIALGYGLLQTSKSLWYFQKSSYALNTNNDGDLAEAYMLQAISAVPNDVYYRALAQIEIYKLNKVLSQDPKKVSAVDVQKQFSAILTNAIKAGIAAKDADPTNYQNWIALGQVYDAVSVPELQVAGAYESAQYAYGQALQRNPKNPGILLLFARLAVTHKDLALAEQYANQAITAKSNYLDGYFLLSQIEVANKDIKGAIDSTTAATVLSPTDAGLFFQLGLLKYNIQDFAGAIQALETATKLTPDYANAKYFLGLSYEATGQHAKAIEQFAALKVTNPDSKEVDAILTNLKAGKPIFTNTTPTNPAKAKTLPVKETVQ